MDVDVGSGTCLESSKVDDTVNVRVLLEDLVESVLVGDIGLVEFGPLAADELDAIQSDLGGVVEVIDNHDLVAVLQEGQRGERSDVAGATAIVLTKNAKKKKTKRTMHTRRQCARGSRWMEGGKRAQLTR